MFCTVKHTRKSEDSFISKREKYIIVLFTVFPLLVPFCIFSASHFEKLCFFCLPLSRSYTLFLSFYLNLIPSSEEVNALADTYTP